MKKLFTLQWALVAIQNGARVRHSMWGDGAWLQKSYPISSSPNIHTHPYVEECHNSGLSSIWRPERHDILSEVKEWEILDGEWDRNPVIAMIKHGIQDAIPDATEEAFWELDSLKTKNASRLEIKNYLAEWFNKALRVIIPGDQS